MNSTERARAIWQAGVDAVQGDQAVISQLSIEDDCLIAGDTMIPLADFDRVLVVGGGKATASMAAGLVRAIGVRVALRGRINVPAGTAHGQNLGDIQVCEARPAGINEPTELAVAGTEAILADVASASPRDLCITLISGGGSALLVAPPPGISLADKLAVTRHLSGSGASIHELNTVRKQLSRIKGGGLLRACRAGRMLTLILSDVIGDPLDIIASGPTVADTAAPGDALAVLNKFDPNRTLPAAIHRRLSLRESSATSQLSRSESIVSSQLSRSERRQTERTSDTVIIGNNAAAVDAAGIRAESLGYSHAMDAATGHEGTAEAVGQRLAEIAVAMLHGGPSEPDCLITGGEPVVRLVDADKRGRGGRNQQLVLAAMIALSTNPDFTSADRSRLVLLSGGTDGEDGPTDAAGAILNESVWRAAQSLALDPVDYLQRNDAYTFFQKTGGLFITGPTGTNVCDVRVLVIER
ncbi:MAG TPA: glycerate kinase [Planctomycetaceae bacterium]|nr:glycerate kinase [Planctomycetaceae bacterium]